MCVFSSVAVVGCYCVFVSFYWPSFCEKSKLSRWLAVTNAKQEYIIYDIR